MNHERFRELLALRLYDELDTTESAALNEHLTACASCRAFAVELDQGLGSAPRSETGEDLPIGWVDALNARIDALPSVRQHALRRPTLLAFATGLAAGLLAMVGWRTLGDDAAASTPPVEEVAATFARATPPPPASGRGPLAQLATLRAR